MTIMTLLAAVQQVEAFLSQVPLSNGVTALSTASTMSFSTGMMALSSAGMVALSSTHATAISASICLCLMTEGQLCT